MSNMVSHSWITHLCSSSPQLPLHAHIQPWRTLTCTGAAVVQRKMKLWLWFATATLLFSTGMAAGRAQSRDASCLKKIAPCMNYLNGTGEPPESCCNPLKSLIDSDPFCLCGLVSTAGADRAEHAGVNFTAANELPGRCGEHVNPLSCLTGSKDSASNVAGDAVSFPLPLAAVVAVVISTISV